MADQSRPVSAVLLPSPILLQPQLYLPVPKTALPGDRPAHELGNSSLPWITSPNHISGRLSSSLPSLPVLSASSRAPQNLPSSPTASQKRKATRTHFNDDQKRILNRYFNERNHMKNYKHSEIKEMERESGLSEHQIRIYFQNKRARSKSKCDSPPPGTSQDGGGSSPASPPEHAQFESPLMQISMGVSVGIKRRATDDPPLPASPAASPRPPPVLQVRTMARIDTLAAKLELKPAEISHAKEFMCSVFDGQYVPLELLTDVEEALNLVASCCIYIVRRQNLLPLHLDTISVRIKAILSSCILDVI